MPSRWMWRRRLLLAVVATAATALTPSSSLPSFAPLSLRSLAPAVPPVLAQIPQTPGWELIVGRCLPCHSLEIAVQQRQGPKGWAAILDRMIGYGAPIPPEDRQPVLDYLLRHYRDPDGR
jgi:hypothetical protein